MTKEKKESLERYKVKLNDSLKDSVPKKHERHPKEYHAFLRNELRLVDLKLEEAKLDGVK